MICVDTTCDEEILQELRARTFAATVQKLRKTAGLVVADKVEIFYEENCVEPVSTGASTGEVVSVSVSAAMLRHSEATIKRIKSLPMDISLCSKQAIVLIKEVITDTDISKNPITIVLTQPCVAVDIEAVAVLVPEGGGVNVPSMAAMYLQSLDYERVSSMSTVAVTVDSVPLLLTRGVHYFMSVNEMVVSSSFTGRSKYPNLPTQL